MKSGIYEIKGPGRSYVGQARDVKHRFFEHKSLLRRRQHFNIHLQRAWDKYGEDAFRFAVLIFVLPAELTEYEQVAIDSLPKSKRYNIATRAEHPAIGAKRSLAAKQRMSDAQKQRMSRPEEREKVSRGLTGKQQSLETREKRRQSLVGRVFSPEHRAKLSDASKRQSTETRLKSSLARLGQKRSPEARERMRQAQLARRKATLCESSDSATLSECVASVEVP